MEEKLAIHPEITGTYCIIVADRAMTGFTSFGEAHAHAIAILSGKESFMGDRNLGDIKIDRKGLRAALSRTDNKIEEKRYATEKDGSISIEQEEHPIRK